MLSTPLPIRTTILSCLNFSKSSLVRLIVCHIRAPTASFNTFSWISLVLWASQKATVATSFKMGISTEQSRPSSRATRGRLWAGPLGIGPRMEPPPSIRGRLTADIICKFKKDYWFWTTVTLRRLLILGRWRLWKRDYGGCWVTSYWRGPDIFTASLAVICIHSSKYSSYNIFKFQVPKL